MDATSRRAARLGIGQPRKKQRKAPKAIAPLVKGKLTGRTVLIPHSVWPDEPCDNEEGWPGRITSEKYGVAAVRTPPTGGRIFLPLSVGGGAAVEAFEVVLVL